eukprot:scpid104739/ scgid18594/ 
MAKLVAVTSKQCACQTKSNVHPLQVVLEKASLNVVLRPVATELYVLATYFHRQCTIAIHVIRPPGPSSGDKNSTVVPDCRRFSESAHSGWLSDFEFDSDFASGCSAAECSEWCCTALLQSVFTQQNQQVVQSTCMHLTLQRLLTLKQPCKLF